MWPIVITKQLCRVHNDNKNKTKKNLFSCFFGVFNANEQTQENQFLLLYIYGLYLGMYMYNL